MQFKDMFTSIQANIGRANATITTEVVKWLNNKQMYLCNLRNWWFMTVEDTSGTCVSTVDGTQEYAYPTKYKDDLLLYMVDSTDNTIKILKNIGLEDAYNYYNIKNDEEEPVNYVLTPTGFQLFPIPDAVYKIYRVYTSFLTDATGLTDTAHNALTDIMPEILIAGTTADGYRYLQEYQDAEYWEKEFNKYLIELKRLDCIKKLPVRVRIVPMQDAKGTTLKDKSGVSRVLTYYY